MNNAFKVGDHVHVVGVTPIGEVVACVPAGWNQTLYRVRWNFPATELVVRATHLSPAVEAFRPSVVAGRAMLPAAVRPQ